MELKELDKHSFNLGKSKTYLQQPIHSFVIRG